MWKAVINSNHFTVIFPLFLIVSLWLGSFIAKRTWISKHIDWKGGGVDSSVVAIYSLLLSFTFFASNNLMRDRLVILNDMKEQVESMRNATLLDNDSVRISTFQFLQGCLPLLADFKERYLASETNLRNSMDQLNSRYLRSLSVLQNSDRLRGETMAIMPYFNRLNGSFIRFVHSYDVRTPPLIMVLLVLSSLLIGILIGFLNSFNSKTHYLVPVIFLVIVTLCIQSIRDLDNPYVGLAQPSFSEFARQLTLLDRDPR